MKAMTIRFDDDVYNKLVLLTKNNKTSINKFISKMIVDEFDKPYEISHCLEIFDNKIDDIIGKLERINKKQSLHFKVTKQHFANRGFLSNAKICDDKCLNELLSKDSNFND